jgi:hypothetical protein
MSTIQKKSLHLRGILQIRVRLFMTLANFWLKHTVSTDNKVSALEDQLFKCHNNQEESKYSLTETLQKVRSLLSFRFLLAHPLYNSYNVRQISTLAFVINSTRGRWS